MTDDATRRMDISGQDDPEPTGGSGEPATAGPMAGGDGSAAAPGMTAAAAGGGAGRLRWAIGLGVAAVAVAAIAAAVLVFGSRPTPPALTYIPGDAVLVVEVRPDLPGDQLQKLGNLLAHFPGFADQSTLPDKLDETFAQLLGQASGGSVDYRADVKPWLSGPAFVALLPASAAAEADPMSFVRGVASLTTTGTVTCDALFEGQPITREAYGGLEVVAAGGVACALDGQQALIGDDESVRAAIDAHAGGSGLDRNAAYQEARASLQGDQLEVAYISGSGYLAMLERLSELAPTMPGMPGMSGITDMSAFMGAFPEWVVQGLRAEDDAIVLDSIAEAAPAPTAGATPGASLLPIPPAHDSVILPLAPATTVFYLESQGTGVAVQNAITQLRQIPEFGSALGMLEGAGDPGELVGWIEDVGLIVVNAEDGLTGGLAVVASDAADAVQRVETLKGLLSLASLGGVGVETSDSTIGGTTVTTVTISDLGSVVPPGELPPGFEPPADATIEFSIATRDRVILLGAGGGERFMTAALSIQPGTGLADQAAYRAATSRALDSGQMTAYVAIRDIVGLIEPLMPAEERLRWDAEVKPYVAPFQALSLSSSVDAAGGGRSRVIITVTNP